MSWPFSSFLSLRSTPLECNSLFEACSRLMQVGSPPKTGLASNGEVEYLFAHIRDLKRIDKFPDSGRI